MTTNARAGFGGLLGAVAWALFVSGASPASAQSPQGTPADTIHTSPPVPPPPDVKRMTVSRVGGGLLLDGRLEDDAWREASFRSDFQQKGRDRGYEPPARTQVAFLYDNGALYVGARMEYGSEAARTAAVGRRDDPGNADRILVSLDTFRDGRTAYTFGVTVSGVRVDHITGRDNESWADASYDPVWQAWVASDSTGWTAEMRIPFSQLRFSSGPDQVWGVNVRRWHPATYLNAYWVMIPYYETGWVSRFGEMLGLSRIDGGAGIEVTPYALGRATYGSPLGSGQPDDAQTRFGVDMKVGLGSFLTLDAAANPDFGQVEADPARVNLTAFETFFPERRPFFSEGSDLFSVRGPTYFYSRRIGSVPGGTVPRDLFERVESASVRGGAKLTGRLPWGTSVGALTALTGAESVEVGLDSTGATTVLPAAPRTLFAVGRLQQELGSQGSSVGLIGTAVERMHASTSPLADALARRALAGGLDWTARFGQREYEMTGFAGGSYVSGDPESIRRLQLSSAHYHQRPDQDHVSTDFDAREMMGWSGGLSMAKVGGAQWFWNAGVEASSPGFEIRDAGSQRRSDRLDARAGAAYRTRDGSGTLRDRSFGLSASSSWNFGMIRRQTSIGGSAALTWGNQWTTSLTGGLDLRALSDDLTRGGPLMGTPRAGWLDLGVTTSRVANTSWSLTATAYLDEFDGRNASVSGGLRVQASDRVELDVQTGLTLANDARQFIMSTGGGGMDTFGRRYVFSRLERKEVFAQFRTKVAFAPDAVLTLYAEPFVASGRFHGFGELQAARSRTLTRYGTDGTVIERLPDGSWTVTDGPQTFGVPNYDFRIRSFRSTGVFRWEWRRGSTLFLIWQRNLSRYDDRTGRTSTQALARSLVGSFGDPGDNIFVAKITLLLNAR